MLGQIKAISSDAFEGRGPATPGEDKTVDYLVGQLRGMGLAPGNSDGGYVQEVPLVGFKVKSSSGSFDVGGTRLDLKSSADWVATSRRKADRGTVEDSDAVFVGYGVVAPEYGWDDYKGLDVRGKTIVMLDNDPPVPDPADPLKLDPAFFKGRAMTYYGRWTYKYEIASEKGAAAAILIHETVPAGYPYSVVIGSWTGEGFDIPAADGNIGAGLSTLDEVLADALKTQGRTVGPDEDPEKGFYYRSDHFEFAKQGVPALNAKPGTRYVGKPADYGKMTRDRYTKADYHKVTDEVKPDWDLAVPRRTWTCTPPWAEQWQIPPRCRPGSQAASSKAAARRC